MPLRSFVQHLPQPHQQLPELLFVSLLQVQVRLIVIDGVDQPPDLILVQIDLHSF